MIVHTEVRGELVLGEQLLRGLNAQGGVEQTLEGEALWHLGGRSFEVGRAGDGLHPSIL